jgi:hypothetical protein
LVAEIDALLAEHLPGVLEARTAEEGALLGRRLRKSIQLVGPA